jgi:ADP-ribose pyrophosphatase
MELELVRRDLLYTGKVFDLVVDRVRYPSGAEGVREVARHPGGAVVVPLFDDGTILFVRQFRYPFGARILELPAGKLSPGEDPARAAARELEEETGWCAAALEPLVTVYSTPGFCDEVLHLFLGRGLEISPRGHRREEGEKTMELERHAVDEAVAMIARGDLRDAKSIVGVLLTRDRLAAGR